MIIGWVELVFMCSIRLRMRKCITKSPKKRYATRFSPLQLSTQRLYLRQEESPADRQLREVFDFVDDDGDGKITLTELSMAVHNLIVWWRFAGSLHDSRPIKS